MSTRTYSVERQNGYLLKYALDFLLFARWTCHA
jgi:hypothetical protein